MPLASSRVLGVVLLLLATTACARGPDAEVLRAELQSRLDVGFEEGLFSVERLQRRGSAPFTDFESGTSGLFVYYDADLRFERDYHLTAWKGLNLGTLAFVAGANDAGVTGLSSEGNQAGDRLRLHGRLTYTREEGEWIAVALDPAAAPAEPPGLSVEGSGPDAVLRSVRDLVSRDPSVASGPRDAAIVRELGEALERIDLRLARQDGLHTLGSGPTPGTYHAFAEAFAGFATSQGLPFHAHPSEGSVANGLMVQGRQILFGLIQSDVAETLYEGWAAEGQLSLPDLRSVASLWPEAVHVVTLEETGIESFEQLAGRRVAIGPLNSGTRFTAVRIAQAAGLPRAAFPAVREESIQESIADLEAGVVDALVLTEAVPSRPLQALGRRRADVRIVPIGEEVLAALSEEHFAYYPLTVPARTYPGQTEDFRTLGLAAALVTHQATPEEVVTQVLELLLEGAHDLARTYYRAGFISRDTVRLGIAVPLHPAAEQFYDGRAPENGEETPPEPEAG